MATAMVKPPRQTWIDYARGIAIILVLYRHVFEGIKNSGLPVIDYAFLEHANILFFSFRMPLFFIVSGIFVAGSLQKRGLGRFIETKARTILYPYFLWGVVQITLQIIMSQWVNSQRTPADYLLLFYLPRGLEQFWYLYALFNVAVLYALSIAVFRMNAWQNTGIGLLMFAVSAYVGREAINIGFLYDIMHYYLFYAIGDLCARFIRDKNNLALLQSWKAAALLCIPFIATQWYFLQKNLEHPTGHYDFVENFEPYRFIFIALAGCAFVICISFNLQRWNKMRWLHLLGRHSLYIYVAHVISLAATRIFMVKILNITNVPALLIGGIVMGLLLPVLLYKLAVKMKMPWVFTLEREDKFDKQVTTSAQ